MQRPLRIALTFSFAVATAHAQPIMSAKTASIYEPAKPAISAPTARIAALLRVLANPSLSTRESAQRSLFALGPAILPQLRYAADAEEASAKAADFAAPLKSQTFLHGFGQTRYPPSTLQTRFARHSLALLIARLEEQRQSTPALISMHFTDAPLAQILRDLGRQLDLAISASAESDYMHPPESALDWIDTTRESVQLDRASYWQALRAILGDLHVPTDAGEQYLQIGSDRIDLAPTRIARILALDDPPAAVAGPLLISATRKDATLTLFATPKPTLNGLGTNASVHIDALADSLGNPLALDQHDFVPTADRVDSLSPPFAVSVPLPPLADRHIADIRGQYKVAIGAPSQSIAIPLAAPSSHPSEKEVFVLEDCEILNAPGASEQPYRKDPAVCRGEASHGARPSNRVNIEDHTLVLRNTDSVPVTFVVAQWLFGGQVTSTPKPAQINGDSAVFRLHAEPGEEVRLHIAVSFDRSTPRQTAPDPTPVAKADLSQPSEFDGWQVRVGPVVREGAFYNVSGELSMPAGSPLGQQDIHLYLSTVDAAGWTIVDKFRSTKMRQEADRTVEAFTLHLAEPGRIPATLLWETPGAMHWLSVPFELHDITSSQ